MGHVEARDSSELARSGSLLPIADKAKQESTFLLSHHHRLVHSTCSTASPASTRARAALFGRGLAGRGERVLLHDPARREKGFRRGFMLEPIYITLWCGMACSRVSMRHLGSVGHVLAHELSCTVASPTDSGDIRFGDRCSAIDAQRRSGRLGV